MTDDEDIYRQCRMMYAQAYILKHRFGMCTDKVKVSLFKVYCAPLYTAHLWSNFKKANRRRLKVAYNDAMRILLKRPKWSSASETFVTAGVNAFKAV